MSSPSPAPIPQNQVPIVKELCERLGFESWSDRQKLLDSTHQWRRAYKCDDGTPGKDLIDWKSATTQNNIMIMTRDYLDHARNGEKFWPRKGRPRPRTVPEYPEDKLSICSLIHQIFWRQNVHETRNAKNPARHHSLSDKSVPSQEGGSTVFKTPLIWHSPSWKASDAHLPQRERALNSPASSSGATYIPSKPVSRLASPLEHTNQNGQSKLPTLGDLMAGTAGSEGATTDRGHVEGNNDNLSDLFEFHGSDDEVLMGPVRKCSKKPQAPVAKMVPNADVARDPNFAFDEQPSTEPKQSGKPQKHAKTPKKRRRIGSRVGSEEDDKDYTPRKSRRKRTTSPKSSTSTHKSNSSRAQEEDDTQPQVCTSPSPSERTSLQKGDANRKRPPPYNSASLMERFKDSRQPQVSPSIPDSTQDSLASASQSQRTVDVMQRYPEMGEHMHTFPAEPQIALMNRNTDSAEIRRFLMPNGDPLPYYQPNSAASSEYQKQLSALEDERARSLAAARNNAVAPFSGRSTVQPSELSKEIKSNFDNESPAQGGKPSPQLDTIERMRADSEQNFRHSAGPSRRTMDIAQAILPQTTNVEETPNGQITRFEAAPLSFTQKVSTQAEQQTGQGYSEAQAAASTAPQQPADAAQTAPVPPSPAHSLRVVNTALQPPAKSSLHIRYTIVKSRVPKFSRQIWSAGGLSGKSMDSLCDEVAALIGRPVLRCISFNLNTSEGDVGFVVERGNPGEFEEMRDAFIEEIRKDKKKNKNTRFEITIEPDPVGEVEAPPEEKEMGGDDEEEFNI